MKNFQEQSPKLMWFTGLSGSGKSTLAFVLERELKHLAFKVYSLDGDKMRQGLNKDLSFSPGYRKENIRKVGEVATLLIDAGMHVISSFISPYQKNRESVKQNVENHNFIEILLWRFASQKTLKDYI